MNFGQFVFVILLRCCGWLVFILCVVDNCVVIIQKVWIVMMGLRFGVVVMGKVRLCLMIFLGVVSNILVLCVCILVVSVSMFVCEGLCVVNISSGQLFLIRVIGLCLIFVLLKVLVWMVQVFLYLSVVFSVSGKLMLCFMIMS